MKTQERVQFIIGQLTLSNCNLQERVEELEAENTKLKAEAAKPEKPKLVKES